MKTQEYTIPSHFLPAIINLDYSGLDKSEVGQLNTWLALNDLSFKDALTDLDDLGFCRSHDLTAQGVGACNCHTVAWPE